MPLAALPEAIMLLIVALGAPVILLAGVAASMSEDQLRSLERMLARMKARNEALLYEGETIDMAQRRLDYAAWIAKDPNAALKHKLRRHGDPLQRALFAMVAPPGDVPPVLPVAALSAGDVAPVADDSS